MADISKQDPHHPVPQESQLSSWLFFAFVELA